MSRTTPINRTVLAMNLIAATALFGFMSCRMYPSLADNYDERKLFIAPFIISGLLSIIIALWELFFPVRRMSLPNYLVCVAAALAFFVAPNAFIEFNYVDGANSFGLNYLLSLVLLLPILALQFYLCSRSVWKSWRRERANVEVPQPEKKEPELGYTPNKVYYEITPSGKKIYYVNEYPKDAIIVGSASQQPLTATGKRPLQEPIEIKRKYYPAHPSPNEYYEKWREKWKLGSARFDNLDEDGIDEESDELYDSEEFDDYETETDIEESFDFGDDMDEVDNVIDTRSFHTHRGNGHKSMTDYYYGMHGEFDTNDRMRAHMEDMEQFHNADPSFKPDDHGYDWDEIADARSDGYLD